MQMQLFVNTQAFLDPMATRVRRRATPPLHAVEAFILALTNGDAGKLGTEHC